MVEMMLGRRWGPLKSIGILKEEHRKEEKTRRPMRRKTFPKVQSRIRRYRSRRGRRLQQIRHLEVAIIYAIGIRKAKTARQTFTHEKRPWGEKKGGRFVRKRGQNEKVLKGGFGWQRSQREAPFGQNGELGNSAGVRYSSFSEWWQRRAPIIRINGRQYREYRNSRYYWMRGDGSWREARDPTDAEIDDVDGETQKAGFEDHKRKSYAELLTMSPKCADYLTIE